MKQTLSLKLGQQLTMTPQLQQAIRLLQLSALDLQEEIQATLESNPMLEESEEFLNSDGEATHEDIQAAIDDRASSAAPDKDSDAEVSDQLDAPIREDLPNDTDWESVYPTNLASSAPDQDYDPLANKSEAETLSDHLLWQLNLTPMSESDRAVAESIIDGIDPNGMLNVETEDIFTTLSADAQFMESRDKFTHNDVLEILDVVQSLDPIGVGARDP